MKVLHLLVVCPIVAFSFTISQPSFQTKSAVAPLQMGLFDGLAKAFSNEEFSAPPEGIKATARHILVKSQDDVDIVMNELQSGISFNTVAQQYSTCPSSSQGGSLGSFRPGTMVKEFDDVIFDAESPLGTVLGPVQTQFGYHMIVIDKRSGV